METSKTLQNWNQVAEIELVYKTKVKASERAFINSSKTAYQLALQSWNPDTIEFFEQFKILLLNQSNKVLGIYEVSSGGISGTVVDLRLIFAAVLKANAVSLIMIHNHPSGQIKTSEADKQITRKIREAGGILDISLLDHIIITPETYYSFADRSRLKTKIETAFYLFAILAFNVLILREGKNCPYAAIFFLKLCPKAINPNSNSTF